MIRFELPGGVANVVTLPDGWLPCPPPDGVAFLATNPSWALHPAFCVTVEEWVDGATFDAAKFVTSMPGGQLLLFEVAPNEEWHIVAAHLIGNRAAMVEQRSFRGGGWRLTLTLTLAASQFAASSDDAAMLLSRPLPLEPTSLSGDAS
jgi:hypothetical protein